MPGPYFYGPDVCDIAADSSPARAANCEMTDLNRRYLSRAAAPGDGARRAAFAGSTLAPPQPERWLQLHRGHVERQGLKVGCLQEIAWNQKWITTDEFRREVEDAGASSYGDYLRAVLEGAEAGRAGD